MGNPSKALVKKPFLEANSGVKRNDFDPDALKQLIGREADCDIQSLDKHISRYHAELRKVGDRHNIRDTSRNGIYLDGEKIDKDKSYLLENGTKIELGQMGGVKLIYHCKKY
ncbi:FHA domain-containing protein [Candidatus Woesearchaeota archaeon]|nr:FHA domain-containing protein [Candidatus Woesearchaeota archaeon]